MANSYYTFSPVFVPGTKVRSDEVNAQYSSLEAAFDLLPSTPAALQLGTAWLGVESGTGNAFAVTMPDTRTSNQEGDKVVFKATHGNSGAATLNIDGLGALSLVAVDGSALVSGDIITGLYYEARYIASSNVYQLQTTSSGLSASIAFAMEWAVKAEDSLISVAAGGDGVSDYSSLHWAAKSAASASAASASASAAAASEAATAADVVTVAGIYDAFDDRYLGSKTSDPTLDNDGNPLLTGALYWNSTASNLRAYTGAVWQVVSIDSYTKAESDAAYAVITDTPQPVPILFNGQFDFWQRGTSLSGLANNDYGPDRWKLTKDGSGATDNASRNAWSPGHSENTWGAPWYAILSCSVAGTGETYHGWQQRLEGVNRYNGQEMTLSFRAYSPPGDLNVNEVKFVQNFGSGGSTQVATSISTTTVISGSVWSHISITFTAPSTSGKTVGTDDYIAIVLQFALNATYTVYISNIQLDVGPVAQTPKRIDVATELVRCQRYYEKSGDLDTAPLSTTKAGNVSHTFAAAVAAAGYLQRDVRFQTTKRTTPTITLSPAGIAGSAGSINVAGTARTATAADIGENSFGSIQNTSGVSWADQQTALFHWQADAEL